MALFVFTFFLGIPSKIYINNEVSVPSTIFILFVFIFFGYFVYTPLCFIYPAFTLLAFENYSFAVLYEKKSFFKNAVDSLLFQKDKEFAKEYFLFFWGNMSSKGKSKIYASLFGLVSTNVLRQGWLYEKKLIKYESSEKYEEYIRTDPPKMSPDEYLELKRSFEKEVAKQYALSYSASFLYNYATSYFKGESSDSSKPTK